jgi:hypothetical protein
MREIERDRQIEENLKLIEEMRTARATLLDNKPAKLTNWKLISVKKFVELMKQELAEEQKVSVTQVDFSKL